jgi:hypothetical protein
LPVELEWIHLALIAASGVAGGAMNSLAGGGTVVTFPALIFAGMDPLIANATSTVGVFPGSIGSVGAYRAHYGRLQYWLTAFIPVSVLGGWAGGVLLTWTPSKLFADLVPYLLLTATILFMMGGALRGLGAHAPPRPEDRSWAWKAGALGFQFLVSVYGGYFGAGIGILMLASFRLLGFHDIHEMNALKCVLAAATNLVAAAYFILVLEIVWPAALALAAGTIAGGYGGAALAQLAPPSWVRAAVVLIGLSLSLVFFLRQ